MTTTLNRTDIAKIMRRELKTNYPKTKFSVRCKSYAGGGAIDISWTDGPTKKSVEAIMDKYGDRGFDGMIDLEYYYKHWLLPDGSIALAGTGGTGGSRGTVAAWQANKPHPDAVPVDLYTGYISCHRHHSDGFELAVRQAFAQLNENERFELLHKTDALRCLTPFERPDRYKLNAELSDFGQDASRIFQWMATAIPA